MEKLTNRVYWLFAIICGLICSSLAAGASATTPTAMPLGIQASLSPDGKQMAFVWSGDVWLGASKGGRARRLTQHPGQEWTPKFSPDGKEIAFVSDRGGSLQIYVVPAAGGIPQKLTDHSEGYYLLDWSADGKSLLARGRRGHVGRRGSQLLMVSREKAGAERVVFTPYADRGDLSPDGDRILFTREGVDLYRKGYRGSQASQVWLYDLRSKKFSEQVRDEGGARSPLWKPDGRGFYYVAQRGGAFNLVERDLKTGQEKQLTEFDGDGVIRPALASNGKVLVFRRGFDFYRMQLDAQGKKGRPKRITFSHSDDIGDDGEQRDLLKSATEVAFSEDGLEIAFVAGGDIWVMDTILREPKQVTATAAQEKELLFSKDGGAIFYVSDRGDECRLWRAKRGDEKQFWWQNSKFDLQAVCDGAAIISNIDLSPDGKRIAFVKGLGDLWLADLDGKNARRVFESWNTPSYHWSPDGAWLAYSIYDNDFNRDVWIAPADGSMLPYNLSRHPDWEGNPRWSPDGKMLAFTGRRHGDEIDIYYAWLQKQSDQLGSRDRSEAKALEAMKKGRKTAPGPAKPKAGGKEPLAGLLQGLKQIAEGAQAGKPAAAPKKPVAEKKVAIDFDGLASRVRRISIPDSQEGNLMWSPDSKRLAFSAKVRGVDGLYAVEIPEKLSPTMLISKRLSATRWLAKDDRIVYLENGVPGSFSKGKFSNYPFSAAHAYEREAKFRVAFRQIWRAMRDNFYDAAHNGKDWDAMREKYEEAAVGAADLVAFETVIGMLLGELNGSHLGFRASSQLRPQVEAGEWKRETAHLGVWLEEKGGKLRVESVVPGGPADREASRLQVGDRLISAGGVEVKSQPDLVPVLNGVPGRHLEVVVERAGKRLDPLRIPTTSYGQIRSLEQRAWVESNRREVERLSGGRLGYLYVARMMWSEFENFEREIYAVGAGKDGIVIDVRDNGGGFTADHLLTVLSPVEHALTVPRGGGAGYPGDRRVYGTWGKPIVVLCNQNSFSNAEIFAHAIKALGRGKVVGVATAGGVISTGSKSIMDIGRLRMPFRGWFKIDDGEDMELNGAQPDVVIWPQPGDRHDRQLRKAVELLKQDVEADLAKPRPPLRRASERER